MSIKDENILDEILEAQAQGHKFIKVYLNMRIFGRTQNEMIISGGVKLIASQTGNGMAGLPEYSFEERSGESFRFALDVKERQYTCHILDDQGPGYFSPIGYNRDLLATHMEEGFFMIPDKEVEADVLKRAEYIKENKKKHVSKKDRPAVLTSTANTPEDIDSHIKYLLEKKKSILQRDGKVAITNENNDIQPPLVSQVPETPEEKVARIAKEEAAAAQAKKDLRNSKQKEYRLKLKADKKAEKETEPVA